MLPAVFYLSSLRFCRDSGVLGTTREISIGATSSCPGIRVRSATTTVATTAKHALKSKTPLSAHFLTIRANHFPPLTSSAANTERQSVTRALGDATLPAAFRILR
ncbi:hypothetical protein Q5P01_024478 [Channa striata]|uniref:Uncharacterized protein n=1 Tax=Channa striata TaxID=64152 RepID=A0AA88ISC4_CHASR|nr:hypothetical protein Q5P01_024478 [Channa striata]